MRKTKRQGVDDAKVEPKQRVNVRMSAAAHQRLQIHSVMSGKAPGEILDDLIDKHCRDWALPAKLSARAISVDRPIESHEISSPALVVA